MTELSTLRDARDRAAVEWRSLVIALWSVAIAQFLVAAIGIAATIAFAPIGAWVFGVNVGLGVLGVMARRHERAALSVAVAAARALSRVRRHRATRLRAQCEALDRVSERRVVDSWVFTSTGIRCGESLDGIMWS